MGQVHEMLDLICSLGIDFVNIFRADIFGAVDIEIGRVGHGYTYKIKPPVLHPLEMLFFGFRPGLRGIRIKKVKQVKPFPGWDFIMRSG